MFLVLTDYELKLAQMAKKMSENEHDIEWEDERIERALKDVKEASNNKAALSVDLQRRKELFQKVLDGGQMTEEESKFFIWGRL
jgi:multidrug resistance efflux pump